MSVRYFLDTNLFVYGLDPASPTKAAIALKLIREGITGRKGVISFQVVQEFFNVAFRRFPTRMTTPEAERFLANVLRPLLAVHSTTALYGEALRLRSTLKFCWYDSLMVSAALQAKCGILYTEDLQHGQKIGSLQIVNPFL